MVGVQSSFAQDEEPEQITIDMEDGVDAGEKDQEQESGDKEVTLEEQLSVAADEQGEEPIISPLKQMSTGISAEDVICREGLELIIKASSGSAACVKSSTATVLIERGWAR